MPNTKILNIEHLFSYQFGYVSKEDDDTLGKDFNGEMLPWIK